MPTGRCAMCIAEWQLQRSATSVPKFSAGGVMRIYFCFFFQAEDGIRDRDVTGVQTCALPISTCRPTGLIVSAFCSVSLDPPQILVCVDHKSQSYPALRDGGHFAVNFLGDGHEDISRRFATTRLDKFDGVAHRLSGHGVPLLDGALAQLECRVVSRHVEGDHTILVGLVEDARNGAGEPLLYYRGQYRRLAETPSGAKS